MTLPCLVPVRRLPTPSRSRHFGGLSEKKNSLGPRDPKRNSRAESVMRPTDKARTDSRSVQSYAIVRNTGHDNFVIGRFHTSFRNGLSV